VSIVQLCIQWLPVLTIGLKVVAKRASKHAALQKNWHCSLSRPEHNTPELVSKSEEGEREPLMTIVHGAVLTYTLYVAIKNPSSSDVIYMNDIMWFVRAQNDTFPLISYHVHSHARTTSNALLLRSYYDQSNRTTCLTRAYRVLRTGHILTV